MRNKISKIKRIKFFSSNRVFGWVTNGHWNLPLFSTTAEVKCGFSLTTAESSDFQPPINTAVTSWIAADNDDAAAAVQTAIKNRPRRQHDRLSFCGGLTSCQGKHNYAKMLVASLAAVLQADEVATDNIPDRTGAFVQVSKVWVWQLYSKVSPYSVSCIYYYT